MGWGVVVGVAVDNYALGVGILGHFAERVRDRLNELA